MLNLPRERFDQEAQAMRNKLLAWRFAVLGKVKLNPGFADRTLEDRLNQIGLPLLAVARDRQVRAAIRRSMESECPS